MSDDERIPRIEALARKVWPKHNLRVVQVTGYGHGWRVMAWDAQGHNPIVLLHVEQHDLSLDALEAALVVLAVETPQYILGSGGLSGPEAYRLHLAFERGRKRIAELEARVLDLEQSLEAERVEGLEER